MSGTDAEPVAQSGEYEAHCAGRSAVAHDRTAMVNGVCPVCGEVDRYCPCSGACHVEGDGPCSLDCFSHHEEMRSEDQYGVHTFAKPYGRCREECPHPSHVGVPPVAPECITCGSTDPDCEATHFGRPSDG